MPGNLSGVKFYQYIFQSDRAKAFDVVIIGGSYAGLSAALILGRSNRRVLVIDSGSALNNKSTKAYNFISHDGEAPFKIIRAAKQQVLKYHTVKFVHDKVLTVTKSKNLFYLETKFSEKYIAKKILLANGVVDHNLPIPGFGECWGISILSCLYCFDKELNNMSVGILANGNEAYDMAKYLATWTKKITIFTNGVSTLSKSECDNLGKRNIDIIEKKVTRFIHNAGQITGILFSDNSRSALSTLFTRASFSQSSDIAEKQLGCEVARNGLLVVDEHQKTSVNAVYAAGDNCLPDRFISLSVASGTKAALFLNKELGEEEFNR